MPVLPYCVVDAHFDLPPIVTGVSESRVELLRVSDLGCVYSQVDSVPSAGPEFAQAAMTFQSVVQQSFGAGMVIAFRFPTLLPSTAELRTHIETDAERYSSALKRLAGLAQIDIRITRATLLSRPEATSGTEYLRQKQADAAGTADFCEQLRLAIKNETRGWHKREDKDGLRVFALIAHERQADVKRALSHVTAPKGLRAVVSGPWPPSEFLDGERDVR